MGHAQAECFEPLIDGVGDRLDLAWVRAAAHYKVVSERSRIFLQFENREIVGLFILAGKDGFVHLEFEVVLFLHTRLIDCNPPRRLTDLMHRRKEDIVSDESPTTVAKDALMNSVAGAIGAAAFLGVLLLAVLIFSLRYLGPLPKKSPKRIAAGVISMLSILVIRPVQVRIEARLRAASSYRGPRFSEMAIIEGIIGIGLLLYFSQREGKKKEADP